MSKGSWADLPSKGGSSLLSFKGLVPPHPFLHQLVWFPRPPLHQFSSLNVLTSSLASELALASVSWGAHQVARRLPKPTWGAHSNAGRRAERQWEQLLTPAQWGLLEFLHRRSSAVPSCKRNWAGSQQMLDLTGEAVFKSVLVLTPVSLQAQTFTNPHACFFPKTNVHWTETPSRACAAKQSNHFKMKIEDVVSKRRETAPNNSAFFAIFLLHSVWFYKVSNVAFERD